MLQHHQQHVVGVDEEEDEREGKRLVTNKQLMQSGLKITQLQEALQKTSFMCAEMVKQLDHFEQRVIDVEPTMMPLSRNLSSLNRVHYNVETTLSLVKLLSEANEVGKREELILAHGPTVDNLDSFLASLDRVREAITSLNDADLGFCQVTIRRLESGYGMAFQELTAQYKIWLQEHSKVEDPSHLAGLHEDTRDIPEEMANALLRIASYTEATAQDAFSEVIAYYGEVRSNFMMQTLQPLIKDVESPIRGVYMRGTHPFIAVIREYFKLVEMEPLMTCKVLPSTCHPDALKRTYKHPSDLIKMTCEVLSLRVLRSLKKGEFNDYLWIFDIIQVFNDLHYHAQLPLIQSLLKTSLYQITCAGVEFLKLLMEGIQGASRSTTTVTASANATVFEQTSLALNCLKKMMEFQVIVETLLNRWAQREWDGIVGLVPEDCQLLAFSFFFKDILSALEVAIERFSQGYKKAIVGILFQINNYNYLLRTIRSGDLTALLTGETEQKYQSIIEALIIEYLSNWRHVASILDESVVPKTGQMTAKDRLKAFSSDFDEIIATQEVCTVPDVELRGNLLTKIRDTVMLTFVPFYNQNQTVIYAMQSKIKLDPEIVESTIMNLFQA